MENLYQYYIHTYGKPWRKNELPWIIMTLLTNMTCAIKETMVKLMKFGYMVILILKCMNPG